MNGIQDSHHISSRMEEASSVKPPITFPGLSQACKQPNTRTKLWTTGKWTRAVGDHELRVETVTRMASTIHGRINKGSSRSTDVPPADVEIPPTARLQAEAMECYCYLRNVQDLRADGLTLYERWVKNFTKNLLKKKERRDPSPDVEARQDFNHVAPRTTSIDVLQDATIDK